MRRELWPPQLVVHRLGSWDREGAIPDLFESASWAPTTLAWSYDNRTAGFRIVGEGSSLRIECRVPGADCNAYLAFAAALAPVSCVRRSLLRWQLMVQMQ